MEKQSQQPNNMDPKQAPQGFTYTVEEITQKLGAKDLAVIPLERMLKVQEDIIKKQEETIQSQNAMIEQLKKEVEKLHGELSGNK